MGFGSIKINSQKVSKTWVEKKIASFFFFWKRKKRNSQKKEQLTLLINKKKTSFWVLLKWTLKIDYFWHNRKIGKEKKIEEIPEKVKGIP